MAKRRNKNIRQLSVRNKLIRAVWGFVWLVFYRPSPVPLHAWRCFLLRLFGAKISTGAHPYPSCRIWAPWNLVMEEQSCLSHYVDCYSVDLIKLGAHATVSQYSFLCTATHDYTHSEFPLMTAPIKIEAHAWVAADVFIGPGVNIGEGAVVGARSTVFRDVDSWTVVAGNRSHVVARRESYLIK